MQGPLERRFRYVALALIVLGAALRVWQTATRGSLWGDEAGLAMNFVGRPFSDIARPFIYMQVAPYLFVMSQKLVTVVAGASDFALRALPLCAGIAALPLMAATAFRAFGARAALLVLALAVPANRLIHYTQEVKPYSLDACMASVIILLALWALYERRALHALGALGVIAPWFSLPSVFSLAGAGVALFGETVLAMHRTPEERPRLLRRALLLSGYGVLWLVSFRVHFVLFLDIAASNSNMHQYYQAMRAFPPFPPRSLEDVRWYAGRFFYIFEAPGSYALRYLAGALFALGALRLLRDKDKGALALLFVVPWLGVFAAAATHRYVLEDRTLLFLVPSMYLLMVAGLDALMAHALTPVRVLGGVLLAALLVSPVSTTASNLRSGVQTPDLEVVMQRLAKEYRSGDVVFVDRDLMWRVDYYRERVDLRTRLVSSGDDDRDREQRLAAFDGTARLWVLIPSVSGILPGDLRSVPTIRETEQRVANALDGLGKRLARHDGGDCALYLYDLAR